MMRGHVTWPMVSVMTNLTPHVNGVILRLWSVNQAVKVTSTVQRDKYVQEITCKFSTFEV